MEPAHRHLPLLFAHNRGIASLIALETELIPFPAQFWVELSGPDRLAGYP